MDVIAIQIRATLGFDDAQLALGLLYYDGTGVPRDRANAMRLFQRAADQGNAKAAWTLAQAELAAHTEQEAQVAHAAQVARAAHAAKWARVPASCAHKAQKGQCVQKTERAGRASNAQAAPMEWAPTVSDPTSALGYTYAGASSTRASSTRSSSLRSAPAAPAAPAAQRRRLLNTERHALSLRFEHRCAHADCRVLLPVGWHADHRVPLADGGPDDTTNMQPLCPPCHMLKTARENSRRQGPSMGPSRAH